MDTCPGAGQIFFWRWIMKRLITGLLLLATLLGCMLFFTGCISPTPNLNLEDAKTALEDLDYRVSYDADGETGIEVSLYAYKDNESLHIAQFKKASTAKLYREYLEIEYGQRIEVMEKQIEIYEHILSTYKNDMDEEEKQDIEEQIEYYKERLEEAKDQMIIGNFGKYVWQGSKGAIEDSKK